jgi:hypothetical protein
VPPTVKEVTVTDPAGRKQKVPVEGRIAYFSDTERRGVYQVQAPGVKQEFAVNLLSRDESATAPQDQIRFGRRTLAADTGTVKTAREFWRWLLVLALLVLGVEWWVFHRRI